MLKGIKSKSAFSLIEISIVIILLGLLVAAIIQGGRLMRNAKLTSARSATASSSANFVKDMSGWYDVVMQASFVDSEVTNQGKISAWNSIAKTSSDSMRGSGTQSTSANQPTYIAATLTSLPQLSFDGGDKLDLAATSFPYGNSAYTVFIVASSTSGGTILNSGSSTSINTIGFDASGNFTVDGGSGGSFAVATSGNNIPQIITHSYDGTTSTASTNKVWVNGQAKTITSVSNGGSARATASTPVTIGATSSGFTGKVGEIIIFSRNLDDSERGEIEKYLSGKWSVKLPTSSGGGSTCALSTVSNGSVASSSHTPAQEGETQTLTCNSGYQATGQTTATCLSGSWSVALGSCVAVCTVPTVSNGTVAVTGNRSPALENDTETLTCNSGYVSSGTSTATCGSTGTWSADLGSCALEQKCTGGTVSSITISSVNYFVHTFTSSGTLTCSEAVSSASYLIVGGGGGGGGGATVWWHGGAGGGAGGFLTGSGISLSATSYAVTVGAGGAGGAGGSSGSAGSNSSFNSITATGGGYGAGTTGSNVSGGSGGSGGGGIRNGAGGSGSQGNRGGNSGSTDTAGCDTGATGGGGAGAVGGINIVAGGCGAGSTVGYGGAGSSSSITGSSVTYAGGGGGGSSRAYGTVTTIPGSGGSGGGGSGADCPSSGSSGTANTGGGGGGGGCYPSSGSGASGSGGSGGSGIVIIRYAAGS